jgi:hypothetical protein
MRNGPGMKKERLRPAVPGASLIVAFLAAILLSGRARAQTQGDVRVTFHGGESLRSMAGEYLGDPNDWEVILYYNGLKSSDELKTGRDLWIPAQAYKALTLRIRECQALVVSANAEGAGILVPLRMERATDALNRSIQEKRRGDLGAAAKTVDLAFAEATKALSETGEKRLQSVSAVLAGKKGTVQLRPNDGMQWKDAALKQELIANDRLRTLSRSAGSILFIDGSRMQMDENALIVIQQVTRDILKNASSVDIMVLEGDVTTLINSLQNRNSFKVASPGVSTDIRSRNFLASRDRDRTSRFSNFEGEMDVTSSGKQVTLSTNEGTKVSYGSAPQAPTKLLPPPPPVRPAEAEALFDNRVELRWNPVDNAAAYLIQISRNKNFTELETTIRSDRAQNAVWEAPRNGGYYWRIRSVDRDRLQGPFSKPAGFTVQVDRMPPFLAVTSPSQDTVVFGSAIKIRGRSENGATVTVNRDTVRVSGSGEFEAEAGLREGKQVILITAVDEAGNASRAAREVVANAGMELFELSSPGEMVSNQDLVSINGKVKPAVRMEADGHPVETRDGFFIHTLHLEEGPHSVLVKAESPEGLTQEKSVRITIDTKAPEMRTEGIPAFTDQSSVLFEGVLSEPAELSVNDMPVSVVQGSFSTRIGLNMGENTLSVRIRDRAGNVAEKSFSVTRDSEPPAVLSHRLSQDRVRGGEIVHLTVKAADQGVGLARTGTFVLEISPGNVQLNGLLKLNRQSGVYEGEVIVPPDARGALSLVRLSISDYLGNTGVTP